MSDIHELSAEERNLYEMSDEELASAFRQARNERDNNVVVDETTSDVDNDNVVEYDNGDTEQPDTEDSDELDQGEDVDAEVAADEPEDSDENEKDNSEEVKEVTKEAPKKYKYKANGQEFEFTEDEVKEQFGKIFGQAMNYTQKMQELKPWRTQISALKENNISHDKVNLMIDVLKGDKNAIAQILKETGVDPLELDIENSKYAPKEYGRSEKELEIEDVLGSISRDPEYQITQNVVTKQWDAVSRERMAENPQLLSGLHVDVKSGVFDKVMPMAMKMKVLDGGRKSDIDYYVAAGQQYYAGLEAEYQQEQIRAQQEAAAKIASEQKAKAAQIAARDVKQATIKKEADKRKAAAPTTSRAGKKDIVDYLDDSDESYEQWYKNLQAKY